MRIPPKSIARPNLTLSLLLLWACAAPARADLTPPLPSPETQEAPVSSTRTPQEKAPPKNAAKRRAPAAKAGPAARKPQEPHAGAKAAASRPEVQPSAISTVTAGPAKQQGASQAGAAPKNASTTEAPALSKPAAARSEVQQVEPSTGTSGPSKRKEPPGAAAEKSASPQKAQAPSKPAGPAVMVVYPPEGQAEENLRSMFILGATARPEFPFRINGTSVPVHPKGGFLAYLPVEAGLFTFRCEQDLPEGTTVWLRSVRVSSAAATPSPQTPAILPETVSPEEDVELRPGDWLNARMRASPGLAAAFTLRGLREARPMSETRPGVYEGAYQIRPTDRFQAAEIKLSLKGGRHTAEAMARGRLSVPEQPPETVAVRSEGIVNVRSGPGQGYILFPPVGTRFSVTGRAGRELRVRLSERLSGWIDERAVERLAPGTPPPQSVLGDISLACDEDASVMTLELSQRIPFQIEESADLSMLRLKLYSTVGHTNWIRYAQGDEVVRRVSWTQSENDVVDVVVHLGPDKLWGYDASWRGDNLRLELRRPPRMAPRPASVLKNRVIALDPGHGPSNPGAVGPRGTWEQDANLRLAQDLQALLQKEGAQTLLLRGPGEDDVPLTERTRRAAARRADVFVSVHNNALSDGENPFERPHGPSVFFYHTHSQALARSVYDAYLRLAPLPGEGLRYGNLFVARMTQMPAILTESAYMIFPAQEELLLDPAQRRKFALSMLEGLRDFLEAERNRQAAGSPRPRKAPKGGAAADSAAAAPAQAPGAVVKEKRGAGKTPHKKKRALQRPQPKRS